MVDDPTAYKWAENFSGVDFYAGGSVPPVPPFRTERVVATAFTTCRYAMMLSDAAVARRYYLIQNWEDDPMFSGNLSEVARKTYDVPFERIVVSKFLQMRFPGSHLMLPGIDHEVNRVLAPAGWRNPRAVLTHFFRNPAKGPDLAIEAAVRLSMAGYEVHAYGDVDPGLIPKCIRYAYRPTNEELCRIRNRTSIFVLPSLLEGHTTFPVEAAACGNVIVATDRSGVEYPKDVGVVVPTDVRALVLPGAADLVAGVESLGSGPFVTGAAMAWARTFTFEAMFSAFLDAVGRQIGTYAPPDRYFTPDVVTRGAAGPDLREVWGVATELEANLWTLTAQKWIVREWSMTRAQTWMGIPILQFPNDLLAMQEIIFETRPDVIIETGTHHGGSALFFAHMLDLVHGPSKPWQGRSVVSVDLNTDPEGILPRHDGIAYLTGRSSTDPEVVRKVKRYLSPSARVMVHLDSDHRAAHVLKELDAYSGFVTPGCYLIVSDTHQGSIVDTGEGPGPWQALHQWLPDHPGFVSVVGWPKYLPSLSPQGYLRRIEWTK
jgi:cephalosporin hydroxylase